MSYCHTFLFKKFDDTYCGLNIMKKYPWGVYFHITNVIIPISHIPPTLCVKSFSFWHAYDKMTSLLI